MLRDTLSVSVGKHTLEFVLRDGVVLYRGPGGEKVVVSREQFPGVVVEPAPPTGKYLSFVVLRLKEDVIVPPGASASLWVVVPIGVVVKVDGIVVDYFNTSRIKRCLFDGFLGNRVITGCVDVSPVFSRGGKDLVGGVNFVVKNSSGYPVLVKRVPILVANVPMFYSSGSAYYPWYKVTVHDSFASVLTNYTSPVENMQSTRAVRLPVFEARVEVNKSGGRVVV